MRTMVVLAAVLLSGCSATKGTFENRVSCTLDGSNMFVSSMYGPIGITSKISSADAKTVCQIKE